MASQKMNLINGPLRQAQDKQPPFWAGLKFFNVYGPNEYHKGRMASVIFHSYNQIKETGKVKLFRSHKPQYKNGEQLRDFIHVDDVAAIMYWMMEVVSRQSAIGNRQSEQSISRLHVFGHVSRMVFIMLEQEGQEHLRIL